MSPATETEQLITKIIEERCACGGCVYPAVLSEIFDRIDFPLTPANLRFLLNYVKERCPAAPLVAASHVTNAATQIASTRRKILANLLCVPGA
jgi:hypothetical protein